MSLTFQTFVSVVPRTFTGPIILATLCQLLRLALLPIMDMATKPLLIQFFARCFLLLINAHGWIRLASAVDQKGPPYLGSWLLLITACQFHMPFYASRMLPNVFALAVLLHSYAYWMQGKTRLAAAGIVFGAAVFRCDLLLLLGSLGLSWLLLRQLSILEALKIGVVTGLVSLLLTVPMDSLLWQRFLWPEGEVLYFNTILGKSSDWGTSPWHWYFTSALPKSMVLGITLVPLSFLRIAEWLVAWEQRFRRSAADSPPLSSLSLIDTHWLRYIIPTIGFIVLYSFLGHKEMRFVFPALPILNLSAAVGMARLTQLAFPSKNKSTSWVARLAFACGVLCILLTLAASLAFVAVSRWNYPGGDALLRLSDYMQDYSPSDTSETTSSVHVHIDVASAMSGVSLFGQRAAHTSTPGVSWMFDKGGYENEHALGSDDYSKFTHLLSETRDVSPDFQVVDTIQGTPRLDIRRARVVTQDTIYILERSGWQQE
jgi:alpha-1,6-mannosyltransferase